MYVCVDQRNCYCQDFGSCRDVEPEQAGCYFRYNFCKGDGSGNTLGYRKDGYGMKALQSADSWQKCLQDRRAVCSVQQQI